MGSGSTGGGGAPGGAGGAPPSKRQSANSTTSTTSDSGSYTVAIDDKAFHKTYLAPFYDTVKNRMGGAMCSMNQVNGTYACRMREPRSPRQVSQGRAGLSRSRTRRCWRTKDGHQLCQCGHGLFFQSILVQQHIGRRPYQRELHRGQTQRHGHSERDFVFHLDQDQGYPSLASPTDRVDVRGNHSSLARTYAAESIALLKNTNSALPLKNKTSVAPCHRFFPPFIFMQSHH